MSYESYIGLPMDDDYKFRNEYEEHYDDCDEEEYDEFYEVDHMSLDEMMARSNFEWR